MNESLRIVSPPFGDWLAAHYPEEFVQAVSTGACCDRHDRYESYPILDALGNRTTMAAALFTVIEVYENMGKIGEDFQRDVAMANWNRAAEMLAHDRKSLAAPAAETKEAGRRGEERAARHEGRSGQPWRKGHR